MSVIANVLGFFAIVIWAMSIQNKDKKKILIFQVIANIFYLSQYLLLKAYTASIMNFISGIRCLTFYREESRKGKISGKTFLFFSFIVIFIGIITYEDLTSLIPIICSIIYMYSTWQNNLNITSSLFIVAAILLAYHNFAVGAYICIIGNIFDIVSAIISTIRFRKK